MRSLRLTVVGVVVATAAVAVAAPATALPPPVFAAWSSPTTATLDGVEVTIEPAGGAHLSPFDASGADFDPAASANEEMTNYVVGSPLTVSFAEPMVDVALYVKYLRGATVDGPSSYTLGSTGGCTWSIQSGLGGATLTGDTLDVSGLGFLDGILLCTGTASELTMSADDAASGFQAMTLATFGGVAPTTTTTTEAPSSSTVTPTAPPAVAADTVTPAFTG